MQPITYTMDRPKLRSGNLAAAIGGILAAGSILLLFYQAQTARPEAAQWFWFYVVLFWSLFVLLSEGLVYLLSLRVPFLRQLANVLLLTTTAFGFAGYAVYLAQVAAPSVAGDFWTWLTGNGPLDPLFAISAVIWILLAVRASKGGALTLGDDGLTCSVYDKRWRWAWHELPAFELRTPSGLIGRLLGRVVAVEGGHKALLTDVWNRPLDAVLTSLNERRAHALAVRREAGIEDCRGEAWTGADLPEISYRQSGKSRVRHATFLGALVLLLSVLYGRYLLAFDTFGAYWAQESGPILAAGGLILMLLAAIAAPLHPRVAARLCLRLDGKSLTLGGLFRRRRWFWYDLSEFELDKGQLSRPAIYFFFRGRAPHAGVESGRIGDIYDAPLDEIAARLNDYREQALAGAPGGD